MNSGHTESEVTRLRAALQLIRALHLRQQVHLGRTRLSGLDQGCITCVCELALGTSADSDCVDTEDFEKELKKLTEPDRHRSDDQRSEG